MAVLKKFPNTLTSAMKGRRSIRNYQQRELKDEDIFSILEAASMAPSNLNRQPWYFIVIKKTQIKRQIARMVKARLKEILKKIERDEYFIKLKNYLAYFTFFESAPIVIAACWRRTTPLLVSFLQHSGVIFKEIDDISYSDVQSVAAAIQNMLLRAYELGIGTCWMTNPLIAVKEIEALLEIKEPWHLLALITAGLPASWPSPPKRRDLYDIVRFI